MIRLRLLVLLAGAAALVSTPALAGAPSGPDRPRSGAGGEAAAHALLDLAAHAATTRTWSGTQYVGTWRGGTQTAAVLEVRHRPGEGSTVTAVDGDGAVGSVVTPDLDQRLLTLLADHYELALAGSARCSGRRAYLVEARREGVEGPGRVAGRFWLDRTSHLVLRREVYDAGGRRLRSSAFVDLVVAPPHGTQTRVVGASLPRRADPGAALVGQRWQPPRALPHGLRLFDAQVREHGGGTVLHLAYSDGLTTLSVFAQHGSLKRRPGPEFRPERVRGTQAWVEATAPERVVWQGDGKVFTLVSDAGPTTVRDAVGALPSDPAGRGGLLGRLGRGIGRVGSWLNPGD